MRGTPTEQSRIRSWVRESQEARAPRAQGCEKRLATCGGGGGSRNLLPSRPVTLTCGYPCPLRSQSPTRPLLPFESHKWDCLTQYGIREGETEARDGIGVQALRSWKLGSQSQDAPWILSSTAASPGRLPTTTLGWRPKRIPRRRTQEAAMTDSLRRRGRRAN